MLYFKQFLHSQSSEWVVFIHGAGGSSAVWHKQLRDFQKDFNLLLIDLRGHGKSAEMPEAIWKQHYTFEAVTKDILEVLDHLKLPPAHFMGVSLGTILARQLAEMAPARVKSLVMAGAVTRLTVQSRLLVFFGNTFKQIIPYMWLYRLFAFVIMPNKNHKQSRLLFINEAKKLYQKEFIKWFKLTAEINPILKWFRQEELNIPTLYIMGEEDYMFLPSVRKVVEKHFKSSQLFVVQQCGHVVNIEQPLTFNFTVISFLNKL